MESIAKCKSCNSIMSCYGNNPLPVELDCFHTVCLPCINKKCEWAP